MIVGWFRFWTCPGTFSNHISIEKSTEQKCCLDHPKKVKVSAFRQKKILISCVLCDKPVRTLVDLTYFTRRTELKQSSRLAPAKCKPRPQCFMINFCKYFLNYFNIIENIFRLSRNVQEDKSLISETGSKETEFFSIPLKCHNWKTWTRRPVNFVEDDF